MGRTAEAEINYSENLLKKCNWDQIKSLRPSQIETTDDSTQSKILDCQDPIRAKWFL